MSIRKELFAHCHCHLQESSVNVKTNILLFNYSAETLNFLNKLTMVLFLVHSGKTHTTFFPFSINIFSVYWPSCSAVVTMNVKRGQIVMNFNYYPHNKWVCDFWCSDRQFHFKNNSTTRSAIYSSPIPLKSTNNKLEQTFRSLSFLEQTSVCFIETYVNSKWT